MQARKVARPTSRTMTEALVSLFAREMPLDRSIARFCRADEQTAEDELVQALHALPELRQHVAARYLSRLSDLIQDGALMPWGE